MTPLMSVTAWCEELLAVLGREAVLATLFFLVVAPLARLLRARAPVFVHALWVLVLLRLVLPVGWAAPWSARALLDGLAPWSALATGLDTWAPDAQAASPAGEPGTASLPPAEARSAASTWPVALFALWLAGVGVGLASWWRQRRRYGRWLAASSPVDGRRALAFTEDWRRRLGVRRRVRLRTAPAPVTPFTLGVRRPVIFLPASLLERGDAAMLEAVIAHEMAHVRRLDSLWLTLQLALRALYFFHPVAWIASARLIESRERLCDRLVLAAGRLTPRAYGRSLLAVLSLAPRAPMGGVPAFAETSSSSTRGAKRRLAMRLTDLFHPTSTVHPRPSRAWAAALVLALFLLPMAGRAGAAGEPAPAEPAPPVASAATFAWAAVPGVTAALPRAEPSMNLVHPLPGHETTSGFGQRKNPFTGEMAHHTGIDVKASLGATVVAAADGVVEIATTQYQDKDSWGTVVVLDHGKGLKTFYSHLDSISVEPGQRVRSGDPIAGAGASGLVTGPHLHFEVWQDGQPVDPATYIDGC